MEMLKEMLKTRCPSCSKLYAVDRQDIGHQLAPQFECLDCKTRFAMPIPNLVEETADSIEIQSVAVKWQSMPELADEPPVLTAWAAVLDDYGNLSLRREFVQTCSVHSCMPYAAFRYQSILDADPGEDIAQKMRNYIMVMVEAPAMIAQGDVGGRFAGKKMNKVLRPLFLTIGFVFA